MPELLSFSSSPSYKTNDDDHPLENEVSTLCALVQSPVRIHVRHWGKTKVPWKVDFKYKKKTLFNYLLLQRARRVEAA